MTTENIGLFKALGARMDYLNERQRIIAQNIANSDTPGYKPQDLKPQDFSSILKGLDSTKPSVHMVSTNPMHLPAGNGQVPDAKAAVTKDTYEVTPTGNAVVMEEQLMKSGQNQADYNLITSLYQKQVRLFQIALKG